MAGSGGMNRVIEAASADGLDRERRMLADAEELAGAGSFEYDIQSATVRWSPGMYWIRGVRAGTSLTLAQADGVDPRDRERVDGALAAALAGDATLVELAYRIVRPDGQVRWVETRDRIERDAGGEAVRVLGVSIDVTERRESERLREAAEAMARYCVSGCCAASSTTTWRSSTSRISDGRYLLYNARFADALGLEPRPAAAGVPAGQVLPGPTTDGSYLALAPAWREHRRPARARGPVRVRGVFEHPERGPPGVSHRSVSRSSTTTAPSVRTRGVSLGTTQRTNEREQLAVAAATSISPRPVDHVGFDGYFKSVNPALAHVLGWPPEEFLARPFIDMVHPDDRAATLTEVAKLAAGPIMFSFVNRYETKTGSYLSLDWNAIVPPDESLMYASARDITERKAIEAALEASVRETRLILETAHDAFISLRRAPA